MSNHYQGYAQQCTHRCVRTIAIKVSKRVQNECMHGFELTYWLCWGWYGGRPALCAQRSADDKQQAAPACFFQHSATAHSPCRQIGGRDVVRSVKSLLWDERLLNKGLKFHFTVKSTACKLESSLCLPLRPCHGNAPLLAPCWSMESPCEPYGWSQTET